MPYATRTLHDFYKASLHLVHMADQMVREINRAEGLIEFKGVVDGPFSPVTLATQFIERASTVRSMTRDDIPGVDPVHLGLVQTEVDEEIIPDLEVAKMDWEQVAGVVRSIPINGQLMPNFAHDLAVDLESASIGIQTARNAVVTRVLPNLAFMLRDLKVWP